MTGPWSSLFRAAAKGAGKQMGKRVRADVRVAERATKYQGDEYFDLANKDSGVSASWIEKLIGESKSVGQLEKVKLYLNDPARTNNLPEYVQHSLWRKVAIKAEDIEQSEFVQMLMANREKVKKLLDMLNDIM